MPRVSMTLPSSSLLILSSLFRSNRSKAALYSLICCLVKSLAVVGRLPGLVGLVLGRFEDFFPDILKFQGFSFLSNRFALLKTKAASPLLKALPPARLTSRYAQYLWAKRRLSLESNKGLLWVIILNKDLSSYKDGSLAKLYRTALYTIHCIYFIPCEATFMSITQ